MMEGELADTSGGQAPIDPMAGGDDTTSVRLGLPRAFAGQLTCYGFAAGERLATTRAIAQSLSVLGVWGWVCLASAVLQLVGQGIICSQLIAAVADRIGVAGDSCGLLASGLAAQGMLGPTLALCNRVLVITVSGRALSKLRRLADQGSPRFRERVAQSSRHLMFMLWIPMAIFGAAIVAWSWSREWRSFDSLERTSLAVVTSCVPELSIAASALMLRADGIAHEETARNILDSVAAQPVEERNLDQFVAHFGVIQKHLKDSSREWSRVLALQALQFVVGASGLALGMVGGWDCERSHIEGLIWTDVELESAAAANLVAMLWPLCLSVISIVQTNSALDEIPRQVTSQFLFSSVERCAFASDFERLRLHLEVMGVGLTTNRLVPVMVSISVTLLAAVVRATIES